MNTSSKSIGSAGAVWNHSGAFYRIAKISYSAETGGHYTKSIVQKREDLRTVSPKRLLQLSAAGERFSGGEEPPESLSADSEIPCAMLLAQVEGG